MTKKTGVGNRRFMTIKNSIMMLVMLVIIFLAVFAWYCNQDSVTATGTTISAAVPEVVQIAKIKSNGHIEDNNTGTLDGSFTGTINFTGTNEFFKFSNDVTSDGISFIIPDFRTTEKNNNAERAARLNGKIVNLNGIPKYNRAGGTTEVKNNLDVEDGETYDYVRIPFYVRSRINNIAVSANSFLAMGVESSSSNQKTGIAVGDGVTESDIARKSSYGGFTSDALVAAMRVSITGAPLQRVELDEGVKFNINHLESCSPACDDACKFLWVPRPDLALSLPPNYTNLNSDDTTNWTLTQHISKSNITDDPIFNKHIDGDPTFKHEYYDLKTVKETVNGTEVEKVVGVEKKTLADASVSDTNETKTLANGVVPTLGVAKNISAGFTNNATAGLQNGTDGSQNNGYYYYKFYLNIWIEGTDSEARRAMDTGKFYLYIEFGNS